MSVIIFILKMLGIVLLAILGILLFLLLLVLFLPACYIVEGELENQWEFKSHAKLSWLFHLIAFHITFDGETWEYYLKILGIRKKQRQSPIAEEDWSKDWAEEEKTKESGQPQRNDMNDTDDMDDTESLVPKKKEFESKEPYLKRRRKHLSGRIRQFFQTVKETFGNFWYTSTHIRDKIADIKNMIVDETNKKAVVYAFAELKYLVKHFRFRKINTELEYSLGDPAATGQALGVLAVMPFMYRYAVHIYPDFESEDFYIRGNFVIKGHVRLLHLLVSAVKLWKQKESRSFMKSIINRN